MHLASTRHFNKMRFSVSIDTLYLNNNTNRLHLDKYNNKNKTTI